MSMKERKSEEVLMTFETMEYGKRDKTPDWYWTVGVVGVVVAGFAFYFKNTLFAVFIILAVVTSFIFSMRAPLKVKVSLYESGIRIGKFFYPFSQMKRFFISEEKQRLYFITDKIVLPTFVLDIEGQDIDQIHSLIAPYVTEETIEESLSDQVIQKLGI